MGTYGGIITAPCCSFCPMPCPPLSRPGIGPLCPSQGGGILNGGPAMCGPPPGGCPCCVPLGVWAFCIDPALGVPLRVLSCGKISGPACFPLSGWGGAWGAGQSAIWDQFMVQYFMMKIMGPDYEKGKYTAASEQQAEQLAQWAKDRGCDGQDISDYVWPKEGKPTPLGIATLSDLSNYWSWQFTEPMKKWRLNVRGENSQLPQFTAYHFFICYLNMLGVEGPPPGREQRGLARLLRICVLAAERRACGVWQGERGPRRPGRPREPVEGDRHRWRKGGVHHPIRESC